MKYEKMTATVEGTNCENKPFKEHVEFELIPPRKQNSYGTGYYMMVKSGKEKQLIDVRYEKTTDIEILADKWIRFHYGKNAKEITKQF